MLRRLRVPLRVWLVVAVAPVAVACSSTQNAPAVTVTGAALPVPMALSPDADPQALQSVVMSMADDWNTALGEAMFDVQSAPGTDVETRLAGLWFLRNGMGASLDIAVGPNPRVAMLDLLVLASLQPWALEHTWSGHGIPVGMIGPAKARLAEARAEMVSKASRYLSSAQLGQLERLAAAWIEAHPRQRLVSFVRLTDFASDRNELTLEDRQLANGLLKEVDQVTSALDDARLLGERALWYAARYPFVIGQQAELTTMRITEGVSREFDAQREALFAQIGRERAEILRTIEGSRDQLLPVLSQARETIESANQLSEKLLRIVQSVDGLVARFDHADGEEAGVSLDELREVLREAGLAADRVTALVEAGDGLVGPDRWQGVAQGAREVTAATVDRILWGAAGIVVLLVCGLALVRLVPQRTAMHEVRKQA